MSSIDQQFIEYIVKSLVSKPDEVKIERRIDEKGVLLELIVDPEDLGRVIGKRGATAQSLRTLLRALGTKNDARYNLKIVDNGEGGHSYGGDRTDRPAASSPADDAGDDAASSSHTDSGFAASTDDDDDDLDTTTEESGTSDAVSRARQELAELDDLDV